MESKDKLASAAPVVDEPDEDILEERQSTVNAIAYEFMKLFGATAKDGWTHDEMQPVFDAAREIITRTFPVLAELDAAAATAAPVEQSDSLLTQIATIADLGSTGEFGDALERLQSIRKLIDRHEGALSAAAATAEQSNTHEFVGDSKSLPCGYCGFIYSAPIHRHEGAR